MHMGSNKLFGIKQMKLIVTILTLSLLLTACNQENDDTNEQGKKMRITYLRKVNDDVVSHCKCDDGRISFPPQLDCPWCGCGWLFACITCRKAFTFVEAVELETTWIELAREDIRNKWKEEPSDDDVASWIKAMKEILGDIELGERYVIIDGAVLKTDTENVEFDGCMPIIDSLDCLKLWRLKTRGL